MSTFIFRIGNKEFELSESQAATVQRIQTALALLHRGIA